MRGPKISAMSFAIALAYAHAHQYHRAPDKTLGWMRYKPVSFTTNHDTYVSKRPVKTLRVLRSMRGGASSQQPGPDDYSATLKDQSKPWWIDENKKVRSGSHAGQRSTSNIRKGGKGSLLSLRDSTTGRKDSVELSTPSWLALAAFPAALVAGRVRGAAALPNQRRTSKKEPKASRQQPQIGRRSADRAKVTSPALLKSASKPKKAASQAAPPCERRYRAGLSAQGVLHRLIPQRPALRLLMILLLAAVGNGGLYQLHKSQLLRSAWPIPYVDPWQALTLVAFVLNLRATSAGGRLDGSEAKRSSSRPIGFFTPASWAFAIWGPIFLGETLFVLFQGLPMPSVRGSWWLADVSPWFASAMLSQTLWCWAFRPWARDSGLLWLPALLLGSTAVALGGAHAVLREAWFERDMELPQYFAAHLPISLHFGWISCAALVNVNGYLASIPQLSDGVKLAGSILSIVGALALAVLMTLMREDPVYGAVIAWALLAVGSERGFADLKGRVDPSALRLQEVTAKICSALALSAALSPSALAIKEVLAGRGESEVLPEGY